MRKKGPLIIDNYDVAGVSACPTVLPSGVIHTNNHPNEKK